MFPARRVPGTVRSPRLGGDQTRLPSCLRLALSTATLWPQPSPEATVDTDQEGPVCGGWRQPVVVWTRGWGLHTDSNPGHPGRLPPELSETSGVVPAPRAGAQRCFPGERQAVAQAPPRHGRTDLAWRRAAGWLCGGKNLPTLVSGAVLPKDLGLLGLANLYARGRP